MGTDEMTVPTDERRRCYSGKRNEKRKQKEVKGRKEESIVK